MKCMRPVDKTVILAAILNFRHLEFSKRVFNLIIGFYTPENHTNNILQEVYDVKIVRHIGKIVFYINIVFIFAAILKNGYRASLGPLLIFTKLQIFV